MTLALVCIGILLPHAALVWRLAGRWSALAWLAISTALVIPATAELLGQPKPIGLEWRTDSEVMLVGLHLIEGEAIYLWIVRSESDRPIAYALPWSRETAEELYQAFQHGPVPLGQVTEGEPHPMPILPPPPKDAR